MEAIKSISVLNNTNPEHLETLDEPSLQILINHYLSVAEKLPDNLSVRERLVELQQELLNRTSYSSIEGVIRQTTDNPIK